MQHIFRALQYNLEIQGIVIRNTLKMDFTKSVHSFYFDNTEKNFKLSLLRAMSRDDWFIQDLDKFPETSDEISQVYFIKKVITGYEIKASFDFANNLLEYCVCEV